MSRRQQPVHVYGFDRHKSSYICLLENPVIMVAGGLTVHKLNNGLVFQEVVLMIHYTPSFNSSFLIIEGIKKHYNPS